jgi:hypothetical protein
VARAPRLALAGWLASPANPLTARVWVNRLWQYHFGRGLVATPSDFGVRGAAPTHPELLDWLAREFLRAGGSTKHVHRLLVTSATYRQSAALNAGNARLDPDNALLWRWRPRRLEAEALRDSALAVSGELEARLGGAGDAGEVKSLRRGLYLVQRRDHPPAGQGLFDGPAAAAEGCPRREVSTVALQALYALNGEFAVRRAEAFAARVRARAGAGPRRQVEEAFALALGRAPDDFERRAAARFLAAGGAPAALARFCQVLLNVNEFAYLE